jgi:hypothetical protein
MIFVIAEIFGKIPTCHVENLKETLKDTRFII